jgi:hypothetical protein
MKLSETPRLKKNADAEFNTLTKNGARMMKLGKNDTALVRIYDSKSKQNIKIIREAEVNTEGATESLKDKYK